MGDDENFDLDDDLGLDDDGGDDFAGSLDDALGDDDGGSGGGGGGGESGDSELDSFFEDLSSIEDMDSDGGGGSAPSPAAPAQAAPQAAAAAAPAAAPAAAKSGGKGKWIVLILLILIGAGGGAGWYFFMNEPETPVMDEMPPMESEFKEEVVRMEQPKIKLEMPKFKKQLPPPVMVEPEPAQEPPPVQAMPAKPRAQYLIQVATCSFENCKEDYADAIRKKGEPVFTQQVGEKFDFIELITGDVYNYRDAKQLADQINRINSKPGQASVASQSNGYRITMGTFPALDRAKDLKFYLEKELQKDKVRFNLEHVRKDYDSIKVYAGPYDSRGEAKKVLAQLRKDPDYSGSFLVRF
ncbi:MAG: SPOR domain-containing protein [bacterium]|nr:SPOR domain-containing protein [bacterium]